MLSGERPAAHWLHQSVIACPALRCSATAANDSIWIATPDNNGDGVADKFQRFLNMTSANLGVAANTGEPTGFLFLNDQTLLFNFQGKIRSGDFDGLPESRIMVIQLHDPRD